MTSDHGVSGWGSGDTLLWSLWSPPVMMTQCPGDSLINHQLTPRITNRDQNSPGELEIDWDEVNANFVVLLNIWMVQWPGIFYSRLLIIFSHFKLRRENHQVESWRSSCSEARDRSWERANNDYPHTRGHRPQLKQIRNLFKRAMMNSDFGTIEHLLFLDHWQSFIQLVTDSLAPNLHFSPLIFIQNSRNQNSSEFWVKINFHPNTQSCLANSQRRTTVQFIF